MNNKIALAVAMLALSAAAGAAGSNTVRQAHQVWGWGASRLVGTYQSDAQVGVCGNTPNISITNTISFNAGGTVTENPRFPPAGVMNAFGIPGLYTRTIGLGSWSYSPHTNHYSMSLRFDFFEDGMFYGTGVVDRDLELSADGKTASGSVQVTMYAADGSVILEQCGSATSTRL